VLPVAASLTFEVLAAGVTLIGMSDDRGNETGQLRRKVGQSLRALGSDLDRLDEAVADRAGLHRTDLRCLEIVARDGPISAGRLAAMAGLSTSAVTSVIDRMERAGRMRRAPDSADRRKVLLEVTALARQEGRAAFAGLIAGTEQLLARYSHAELLLLDGFLDAVRALVTSQAVAQSPGEQASRTDGRAATRGYGGR
jgi:DNA-binding MarR family transcriptional regulator